MSKSYTDAEIRAFADEYEDHAPTAVMLRQILAQRGEETKRSEDAEESRDNYQRTANDYYRENIGLRQTVEQMKDGIASVEAALCIPEAERGFDFGTIVRAATAAKARISELEEALKPFANEADARAKLVLGEDIDHWPIGGSALTLGDIRRARSTLSPQKEGGKP